MISIEKCVQPLHSAQTALDAHQTFYSCIDATNNHSNRRGVKRSTTFTAALALLFHMNTEIIYYIISY